MNKGYQKLGSISSVVTTKIKGYEFTSTSNLDDDQLQREYLESMSILDITGKINLA